MEKRYFYTDPLAAAWMQAEHGMLFTDNAGNALLWETRGHSWAWRAIRVIDTPVHTGYIYIHPDSLHLLEPKAGDKVSYSFGVGPNAGEVWDEVKRVILSNDERYPYTGKGEPYVLLDGCDEFPISRLTNIFQRDGKAFHWPESEGA